jgi:hypothetical protein
MFAARFTVEVDEYLLQRIWNIVHFIHTVIVRADGSFNPDRMLELFDGRVEIDPSIEVDQPIILWAFRFSVSVVLMVSVGLAPSPNDEEELFRFLSETDETCRSLPLKSADVQNIVKDGMTSVISMMSTEEFVAVVRLGIQETKWSFFALESEMIRGYWVNEAREILFLAMSSRERNSIQFDVQSLRNMTNQSCNKPIGYPAYVSPMLESYSEKD